MKAIAAYMASRSTSREGGSERRNNYPESRNEPGRREYENRRSEYEGAENRVYSADRERQPNQYPARDAMGEDWPEGNEMRGGRDGRGREMNDYGGAESRYRGRDGRWKAGRRRSEYDGGAYDNYPMDRRMGGDDDEEEEEKKKYNVTVQPKNVIQWPYMPGMPHMPPDSRMIGFGNRPKEYENRSHYDASGGMMPDEQMRGMHGMDKGEGQMFDKQTMEKWVNHMRDDKENPIEPWSVEEIKPLAARFGYPTSGEKFDNFYTAIHMMKSDFCAVAEDFDVNTPVFYAAMADAWLRDPDAALQNREKLEAYYKYVVKGKK